ncbi:nucleoside hydrolase [Actinomyces radicidentis]|uniref:Nucleoside hydrolase n=1 Tax=Actinomyces radicidentis TaxID=111015 RepID=A0A0X8JE37_ACTRD|nr:nucleoside hydrolase [Actinomyces radicidentis]AMD86882.1 nucleoside hydrolase [Actinomyces radicidentis]
MTRKMILDLDTGIDDALAIAYAVASPEVELVGVTTTYGNVTVGTAARNTLAVLEALGAGDVPVHLGRSHSRTTTSFAPTDHAARIHGRNGLGEAAFPEPVGRPTDRDAVDVIIEAAHHWGEDLLYVPTGSSTNIAAALEADPSIRDLMGSITMMGGALTVEGNVSPFSEANISQDPEAADLLMRSGAPVVMVGLDVTHQTLLTKTETSAWRETGTEAGRLFAEMTDYYTDFESEAVGIPGCALHDPLAVAVAIDPGLVTLLPINMQVDLDGATRGRTIGRLDGLSDPVKSARVAVEVDAERFLGEFTRRVGGLLAR